MILAYKKAFKYTIPVLAGYLFIGIAFGVLFYDKGYNVFWAILMSLTVYAGSGQYLAVNFFTPGFSLIDVCLLTLMVNLRHIFYGISLLNKFKGLGLAKLYLIFSLTDETYSLLSTTNIPSEVNKKHFLLAIASLNQSYWIIGTIIGSSLKEYLKFNSEGIDFAMTALFLVLLIEQFNKKNLKAITIGLICSILGLLIIGKDFIFFSMLASAIILISSYGRN